MGGRVYQVVLEVNIKFLFVIAKCFYWKILFVIVGGVLDYYAAIVTFSNNQ